jgi:hypothetical protein
MIRLDNIGKGVFLPVSFFPVDLSEEGAAVEFVERHSKTTDLVLISDDHHRCEQDYSIALVRRIEDDSNKYEAQFVVRGGNNLAEPVSLLYTDLKAAMEAQSFS